MPFRFFIHYCPETNSVWRMSSTPCTACGQAGKYDGWGWSGIEAMGWYARLTGLKPIGPHRGFADVLFDPITERCPECDGRGLFDVNEGEGYRLCAPCGNTGYVLNALPETVEHLRSVVLELYPGAASRR